jgi:hypothetical protein
MDTHASEDLNAMPDEAFRLHLRHWIEANYPPEIRNPRSGCTGRRTRSGT